MQLAVGKFGRAGRFALAVCGALLVTVLLSSCSVRALPDLDGALKGGVTTIDTPSSAVEPLVLRATPRLSLKPAWERSYTGPVRAGLSRGGRTAIVFGQTGAGGVWGLETISAEGAKRWPFTFPERDLRRVTVESFGPDPLIVALANGKNMRSKAYVLDAAGKRLWSKAFTGDIQVAISDDGARAAFTDGLTGAVTLTDGSGGELARLQLGTGVAGSFVGGSQWLLLTDQRRVQLVGTDGKIAWQYESPDAMDWRVALSPTIDRIAVTTGQPDSAVYMFDQAGQPQWRQLLFPGGRNEPVLAPAGDILYVYDVGDQAGVYAFTTASGTVNWRLYFAPSIGYRPTIRTLRAVPDKPLLLHYVETPVLAGLGEGATGGSSSAKSADEWHALVWVSPQGEVLGYVPMNAIQAVTLSHDGSRAISTGPAAGTAQPPTDTIVRYYDLRNLTEGLQRH